LRPVTLTLPTLSGIVTSTLEALAPVVLSDPTVTAGSVTVQLDPLSPAVIANFTISGGETVEVASDAWPFIIHCHVIDIV
jgi:hypothetical protein